MKIDEFLPRFDFNEVHKVTVKASPPATFAAMKDLPPSELSPLVFFMLNLRELPANRQVSTILRSGRGKIAKLTAISHSLNGVLALSGMLAPTSLKLFGS